MEVFSKGVDSLTVDELLFCYKPCQIAISPRFWTLNARHRGLKLVTGKPLSNREWKDDYIFVCGDNWEGLPWEEKDDDFIDVRREWGVPSSFGVCVCFLVCHTVSRMFRWFITDVSFLLQRLNNWS